MGPRQWGFLIPPPLLHHCLTPEITVGIILLAISQWQFQSLCVPREVLVPGRHLICSQSELGVLHPSTFKLVTLVNADGEGRKD